MLSYSRVVKLDSKIYEHMHFNRSGVPWQTLYTTIAWFASRWHCVWPGADLLSCRTFGSLPAFRCGVDCRRICMEELQRGEIAWPLPGANGVGKWHTCETGQRKLVEISFRDNGLLIRRGGQHQQEKVLFPSLGAKCLAVVAATNRRFQREGEGQKCPMLQMRLPQGIQAT